MVSFEIFVKAMPPSLLELKVLPSFCFAFKIPDDVAASNTYCAFAANETCQNRIVSILSVLCSECNRHMMLRVGVCF